MSNNFLSVNQSAGYWGEKITSTIDWCEVNYEITDYIAEFWNTVSNLVMIILPIICLHWSIKQKHNNKLHKYSVSNSLKFCFLALCSIGVGL